jgi:zinc protease
MIFAITNPKNMAKVDKAIKEEVEKFLKDGPTPEELSQGKRAVLETLKVERSNDGTLAAQLAGYLFTGRTFEFAAEKEKEVQALTPAGVREAFKKYVSPGTFVIIKAGDFTSK